MAITSGRVTTEAASAANWLPQMWATETQDAITHETLLTDSFDTQWEDDLKYGTTGYVRRKSHFNVQTKTEGTDVTFERKAETRQSFTTATHEYSAAYVEDYAEAQIDLAVRGIITDEQGYALARGLEVSCAALFQNYATNTPQGTLGQEPVEDHILNAWRDLGRASVPMSDRFLALSVAGVTALARQDVFRNQLYGGAEGAMTRNGRMLGEIMGAKVLMSNLLRVPAAGQAEGAMYHREQNALIRRQTPVSVLLHNPAGIGWQVVHHNIYGVTEVNRNAEDPGDPPTVVDSWGTLLRHNS